MQLAILYNREIWPKSVRCKIVDLRSRICSLYPDYETCAVDSSIFGISISSNSHN